MGKKAEQHYQAALNIDLKHEHVHQYLSNLCTAAKLRHPSAIYTLSLFFQFGDMGLRQNLDLAERLRQISFKLNHPHAIYTYALDAFSSLCSTCTKPVKQKADIPPFFNKLG